MKKNILALAALASLGFSGAAMAQSSVTLFGVVDTAVHVYDGSQSLTGMSHSGNSSSRLGFRGVEDLGNGLKAQFWLEGAVNPDDGGTAGAGGGEDGFEFKRRSTVSLMGDFGEVRLGRGLTTAYEATSRYDVFGTVGIGQSAQFADIIRTSNTVGYYSPSYSGFKFGVNYGFGEVAGDNSANRYLAAGLTYDNGPLSLGLGLDQLDSSATSNEVQRLSIGGSYDFGVAKLNAAYTNVDRESHAGVKGTEDKDFMIGVSAPVGSAGVVKASYNRYESKLGGVSGKADQFSLGYVHNMSKRTAVYGTYAFIDNNNRGNYTLSGGATAGLDSGKQHGVQVGVKHSF